MIMEAALAGFNAIVIPALSPGVINTVDNRANADV
jgi:hypothetical protein